MNSFSRRAMLQMTTAAAVHFPAAPFRSTGLLTPDERAAHVKRLMDYLSETAPQLLRPALGKFRFPSIAPSLPGREYSASLWDWDTLWTCRGLFAFAARNPQPGLHDRLIEHAKGSFLNFFAQQNAQGRIPILMTDKDTDLLRSTAPGAPISANQAKPVFAQLALLIADNGGGTDWLHDQLDPLLRFYAAWDRHNLSSCGLYVWGNDVAIGNDNDPTTFGRPDFSSANLLLNSLFLADLNAAAELAGRLNRPTDATLLKNRADRLQDRIRTLCWDERDRFFYTVDVQCHDHRAELLPQIKPGMAMSWHVLPLRIQTFTGFLPLWCGAATAAQARALVAANYAADERLRCAAGVRSLSRLESMYSLVFSSNPSNWLGPVWIIANYLVWSGLKRYGFKAEARAIADKTLFLLSEDIARNGSMNEYYSPDTGEALSHKGFMDWNLLVLEMIA